MLLRSEVVTKPKDWPKPPRLSRTEFIESELRHLADNMEKHGVMNPLECLPDGEIISGHRRWRASLLNPNITELPVRIITDPVTAKEIRIRRLSENLQRADISFWDKHIDCKGFIGDEPGITLKEIAAAINVDPSSVTRYLCPDRCIEPVRQAAQDGRLNMKNCYAISKLPHDKQAAELARLLKRREKASGAAGTIPGDASTTPPRRSTLRLPLPSGFWVAIGSESCAVTVKAAIPQVMAALAMLKEAEKEGLGEKALAAVCEDKAAAKPLKTASNG